MRTKSKYRTLQEDMHKFLLELSVTHLDSEISKLRNENKRIRDLVEAMDRANRDRTNKLKVMTASRAA